MTGDNHDRKHLFIDIWLRIFDWELFAGLLCMAKFNLMDFRVCLLHFAWYEIHVETAEGFLRKLKESQFSKELSWSGPRTSYSCRPELSAPAYAW